LRTAKTLPLDPAQRRLELLEKEASVGQLAAGVVHDLNNLLATLSVQTSILRSGESDPWRMDGLRKIDATIATMGGLTRALLGYARSDPDPLQPVALNELATEVISLLRCTFPPGLELRLELNASRPILGNRSRLAQLVINLALNAREAIQQAGTLTLRSYPVQLRQSAPLPPGEYVALEVVDTGPGIPPQLRSRVFEPYFSTKPQGTGLGLPTAWRIVNEHRGLLQIAERPGPGAVLIAYFPAAD
jgi:signal transduction histidine kinase